MIGGGRCPIVDTWWQTETGGIMMTPLPGAIALKPGSCTKPLPGVFRGGRRRRQARSPGRRRLAGDRRPWPACSAASGETTSGSCGVLDHRARQLSLRRQRPRDPKVTTGSWAARRRAQCRRTSLKHDRSGGRAGQPSGRGRSGGGGPPARNQGRSLGGLRHLDGRVLPFGLFAAGVERPRSQGDRRIGVARRHPLHQRVAQDPSGKIMRRLLRDIAAGRQTVGDTTTLEDYSVLARLRTEEE